MDVHTSVGKQPPSAPKPDLDLFLAIPALYSEGMSDADWDREIDRMFAHSQMARRFIDGQISPADFECWIAESGIDPYDLADLWEGGDSLLLQ